MTRMVRPIKAGIIGKSRARKALDLIEAMYPGAKRKVPKSRIGKWGYVPIRQDDPAYLSAKARTKRVSSATPPWADRKAIRAVYELAARMTIATGIRHHVDHIIPLKGDGVSGLHVHYNLRVLTAEENMRKGNRLSESGSS